MRIVLYSTNCPRCKVLKMKMDQKNVEYTVCTDVDEMRKLGLLSAPYLGVDDKLYDFTQALQFVNNL